MCQKNIDKALAYLQKRGLSKDTLEQVGVGYDTEKQAVVIPYNRNFTYYQLRGVNSKWFYKPETAEAGPEPIWNESILYRKDTKPIFVVESPICAMSIIQYSGNAIALGGLGKSRLIEICKKHKPTATLILSLDNDDKGQPQQEEIYDKLKDLGIKVIQFNVAGHCKDPNDLLKESPSKLCERIYQGNLQAKRVNQSDTDICDARDLYDMELEPTKWIVEGLIPEGLTILVAASKVGKSWMVMQLANAIIEKKAFLDRPTNNSAVLYYALEDSDKRFKSRMNKVWHNKKPSYGYYYKLTANTLDTGLIKNLTEIVKKNKDIKVIVFDTFQKIRGSNLKSESAYAHDYREMGILKQFCDRYGVSIILIHHTRKMLDQNDVFNMTSGSTAIMGASDTSIIIYKKKRTDEDATLSLVGRDVREQEIVINRDQDKGTWSVVGTPEEQETNL